MLYIYLFCLATSLSACGGHKHHQQSLFFKAKYNVKHLTVDSASFGPAVQTGIISNPVIEEASGLAASKVNRNLFYTINDSGNKNLLFLLDKKGNTKATFTVAHAKDRDWEDITVGPGPVKGQSYIYIADIGDNLFRYDEVFIYRLPEPLLDQHTPAESKLNMSVKITMEYPDAAHNAESMFVDPLTKDIYIVTKEEVASVFIATYPQSTDTTIILKKLGELPLFRLTAGDMSPDGKELLLKNYGHIYYWKRQPSETIVQMLQRSPTSLNYMHERQGESICWTVDGSGFYTTSETVDGFQPPLYYYKRN